MRSMLNGSCMWESEGEKIILVKNKIPEGI